MSDGQNDEVCEQMHEGPPLAYVATGGERWQSGDGWGYRPANKAAAAHCLRRWADATQQRANDLAALGMGRGYYPQRSALLAAWAKSARQWAEDIAADAG